MTEVAAGVIIRDGRILMGQRPKNKKFPFTWECPGGKVEGDESHHDAIRRELFEELTIKVGSISERCIWSGQINEGSSFYLHFYLVTSFNGVVTPREGQGFGWFTPEEMKLLVTTPGNKLAMPALLDLARILFP